MKRLATLAALALVSGCSWFGQDNPYARSGPVIGDVVAALPALELPSDKAARPDEEEVLTAYEKVYGLIADQQDNLAVGKRLADLKMDRGARADIDGAVMPYQDAALLYESLLAQSEEGDAEQVDQILYQLARAHDVQGEGARSAHYLDRLISEYPDSEYVTEAHFRRAETAFSQGDYQQAAEDYGVVVAAGQDSPFWQNANYMRGWALFKQSDLEPGLSNFFAVIEGLVRTADGETPVEDLPGTDQELLNDSLRVVTLALGYLDGAATLAKQMEVIDQPSWQYLVYQHLAEDHLRKERYLDSVATWQTFVDENPLDLRAPAAHQGMIETLVAADFPSEVPPKKAEYVQHFGVRSDFWGAYDAEQRSGYLPTLKTYLTDLATQAHADAQQLASAARRGKRRTQLAAQQAYDSAADWYEQIVETFPADPGVAEQLFLLGEVYTEAAQPQRAVAAYQRLLREFPEHEKAAEAGYAAILGLATLQQTVPMSDSEQQARLAQQKIDAQVEFALLFADDARAPSVQADAANSLFSQGRMPAAVELASMAFQTWPALSPQLQQANWLIIGHGSFELQDFATAEQAYRQFLSLADMNNSEQRRAIAEKRLAAVYKQGEAAEAEADYAVAVGHYQRLQDIDFNAELTVQGQFDAIAVVEGQQQLSLAAKLLEQFRSDYPQHALAQGIDMRLAGLFEQNQDYTAAAREYASVSRSSNDTEVARQSLYRAAQLYLEQQDVNNARATFSDYVERFPKPLDLNLEAVHQLDTFAVASGDESAHLRWLDRKLAIHRRMGKQATERATFLAADAQFELAGRERVRFAAIALQRPLAKSLARKTKALKSTVAAYESVAQYRVRELASASTHEIADLYVQLARDIMASERPAGLSALELEQYTLLLEEQAYPFEEQAIGLHEINMQRSWDGVYDEWVQKSFAALRVLMPARFDKQERQIAYVERIH